jgi:hypothetical protein
VALGIHVPCEAAEIVRLQAGAFRAHRCKPSCPTTRCSCSHVYLGAVMGSFLQLTVSELK